MKNCYFLNIPKDIFKYIFEFLHWKDILRLQFIYNHQLHNIVSKELIPKLIPWRQIYLHCFENYFYLHSIKNDTIQYHTNQYKRIIKGFSKLIKIEKQLKMKYLANTLYSLKYKFIRKIVSKDWIIESKHTSRCPYSQGHIEIYNKEFPYKKLKICLTIEECSHKLPLFIRDKFYYDSIYIKHSKELKDFYNDKQNDMSCFKYL